MKVRIKIGVEGSELMGFNYSAPNKAFLKQNAGQEINVFYHNMNYYMTGEGYLIHVYHCVEIPN